MASSSSSYQILVGFSTLFFFLLLASSGGVDAQLSPNFYRRSCPSLSTIVRGEMQKALRRERRMGASILRLFFHDCFVQGCDGSLLLDGSDGEKNAFPNRNARGFEVIDTIKASVEARCPGVVSCADILALATLEGVKQLGGPSWKLDFGRRDSRTSSQSEANSNLPGPASSLSELVSSFARQGLDAKDMTALSGGHTIGQGQCFLFRQRIYNETNIDPKFAATRRLTCPASGGNTNLAPLDGTPIRFDNNYYRNLVAKRGLFHSDQELFNGGTQDSLVRTYSTNPGIFFRDFSNAMTKMSNLAPLTGSNGEIRKNCRVVN